MEGATLPEAGAEAGGWLGTEGWQNPRAAGILRPALPSRPCPRPTSFQKKVWAKGGTESSYNGAT